MHFTHNIDWNRDTQLSKASYSPVIGRHCHLGFVCFIRNVKKNGMDRECGTYGRQGLCVQAFVGRTERRSPLGRPRCWWKDYIKMDFREVGWGVNWIDLAQVRDAVNFLSSWIPVILSGITLIHGIIDRRMDGWMDR